MGNAIGGTNWPGVAYDPELHTIFAQANNVGITATSVVPPPPNFSDIRYVSGVAGRPFIEVFGPGDCSSPLIVASRTLPARGAQTASAIFATSSGFLPA